MLSYNKFLISSHSDYQKAHLGSGTKVGSYTKTGWKELVTNKGMPHASIDYGISRHGVHKEKPLTKENCYEYYTYVLGSL